MLGQRPAALALEGVILPPPAVLGGAPARGDGALLLQAVQDRVQHAVGPLDAALGQLADALDDGVAVGLAPFEDRQHERRRRRGHEVFGELHGSHHT
jgi:hypothetical protein